MIYFFINIMMYLIITLVLVKYFKDKMNSISFIIILFNLNIFFLFIYQDISFIFGIFITLISIIFYNFINLFTKNNEEVILIKDGNINFRELLDNYSYFKLINYLKLRHVNINEINYCIKKGNRLTIIKNKNIKFPVSIIIDGKLIDENLKLIKREEKWLNNELIKRKLTLNNIDFAYYKNNHIYFVNNS